MATANFLDKISLGLSQVLKGYKQGELDNILSSKCIGVFFDENAANTFEGRASLDLIVRLLARLYSKLQIESKGTADFKEELISIAKDINPEIEIVDLNQVDVVIVVGLSKYEVDIPTFYIGSNNWVVNFSSTLPTGSMDSNNPFAAGVSACIGVANIFRLIFRSYLPYSDVDQDFSLSLLDYSIPSVADQLQINDLNIDETIMVGLGAIGNGVIWALNRLKNLKGKLVLIDDEKLSLSNLQRYVLTTQKHIGLDKTDIVSQYLTSAGLDILPKSMKWGEYISERGNWNIETILTCIDNAEDRILIQGTLPRKLFNAWTQNENLGVSRHINFNQNPCLCCLYYPTAPKISQAQEVANNLNLGNQEPLIRGYLANDRPMDQELLKLICTSNKLDIDKFVQFIGQSISIFYSEVVCGGVLLKSSDKTGENIEVPSAFESAMAGILLAAELTKDKLNYKSSDQLTTTQFNLIRAISKYLNIAEIKHTHCICNDPIYKNGYLKKWGE